MEISKRRAEWFLVLVAAFWGLTFPLIHDAVTWIDPWNFVFFRFGCATCMLLPFVLQSLQKTTFSMMGWGFLLGLLNCLAYGFQSLGLKTISADASAFITSSNVLFVPILSIFMKNVSVRWVEWGSVIIGFIGLYILLGGDLHLLSAGEYLTLLSALSIAVSLIVTQLATRHLQSSFMLLTFYQILFTTVFSVYFVDHFQVAILANFSVLTAILFCSLFATVLAFILQVKFQRYTTVTKTALIFCLEPVFAVLFALWLNGERLNASVLMGGALILCSIVFPDGMGYLKRKFR